MIVFRRASRFLAMHIRAYRDRDRDPIRNKLNLLN